MRLPVTDSPILFIVFNRPEATAEAFEAIRRARPTRLYVAADGARDRPGEAQACARVRALATDVDWDCTVVTLFHDANLGCRYGVQSALDWFFSYEESGIILEDDCVPDPSFFPFVTELLSRYRDDERVMMISGDYFAGRGFDDRFSYYFTRFTHIWGWATWRRAWLKFDGPLNAWPAARQEGWLLELSDGDTQFADYWTGVFDRVRAGEIDTWDYSWLFTMWRANALAAQTSRNLVTNIGFGSDATHTVNEGAWQARLATEAMEFPLRHPPDVEEDLARDRWTEFNLFGSHKTSIGRKIADRWRNLR